MSITEQAARGRDVGHGKQAAEPDGSHQPTQHEL